jgi:peptidoglycan/xylan/chitin deacetylase (PgdA/CDA1 family)
LKRFVKCAISLAVFGCTAVRAFLIRLVGAKPRGSCVVLYYHSIPEDQRQRFAKQLDVLLRYATPTALSGDVELPTGVHLAAVTFDDGFQNFYEHAMPELKKRQIPVVMFVIADASGKAFGPLGHSEKVMSLDQLRSLPEELVTIGSHTLTHPMLSTLSEDEARQEIAGSRAKLESILNRKIRLFSFPFGCFNHRLVELCKDAGYSRVFTTLPKCAFAERGEFAVGRVRVDPTDWSLEFRLKLNGSYRWLPVALQFKRLVVSSWLARTVFAIVKRTPQKVEPRSMIQEFNSR